MTVWKKKQPPEPPPEPPPVVPEWSAKQQATLDALEAQRAEYRAKHDAWMAHLRKPLDEWINPSSGGIALGLDMYSASMSCGRKDAIDEILKDPAKAIRLLRPFLQECEGCPNKDNS
jgi:hypothetical protein